MEDEPAKAPTRFKLIARIGRRAYLAGLGAAIIGLAATRSSEVAAMLEGTRPLLVAAALASTFVLIGLVARFWALSLGMLGHPASTRDVVTATARALPARYVPLGVTFALGRITLLRAAGIAFGPLTVTAALEVIISATVALTLGMALLAASGSLPGGLAWMAAAAAVAAAAASPAAGGRVLDRLAARRGVTLKITWSGYAKLVAAQAAYWAWASATFVIYLRAFPAADGLGSLQVAGAFMVAWALGLVAVFAPQGIGVAELGMVALLAGANEGTGIAMAAVFGGYRLVQIARDMVAAAAAEVIANRRARRGSAPTA